MAVQQAVDSYFSTQQTAEGFFGISSSQASFSPAGPWDHVTSGSSAFEDGQPVCLDTPFEIGSITKSFTAVMILKL